MNSDVLEKIPLSLTTTEAMSLLKIRGHETFKRVLAEKNIKPAYRSTEYVYRGSDLIPLLYTIDQDKNPFDDALDG